MTTVKAKTILATLALVLGAVGACNGKLQSKSGGSETNWLATCGDDSDCTVGHCVCGVCTEPCENGVKCPGDGPDTCVDNTFRAFGVVCGAVAKPPANVCLPGCGSGKACATGTSCENGACVPNAKVAALTIAKDGGAGGSGGTSTTTTTFIDLLFDASDTAALGARCLPRTLSVDAQGEAPCSVIAVAPGGAACSCHQPGFNTPSADEQTAARNAMREMGACDVASKPQCDTLCVCDLIQATGTELTNCRQSGADDGATPGWCYIDADAGFGDSALVANCPPTERRILRRVGNVAAPTLLIACTEASVHPEPAVSSPPAALGDPCIPQDEFSPVFSGFAETEVSVESDSPSCESGICLVNYFRGRASCPYGQEADVTDPTAVDPSIAASDRCYLPGASQDPANLITVPARAQLLVRAPSKAVYCSCRCDGAAGTGPFCACPGGYECQKLVDSYGTGGPDVAGSYCIKTGTGVDDPTQLVNDAQCDRKTSGPFCDNR